VIVLTGSAREDDLVDSYKGGAVAFLHKSVDVERLLTAIGDLHGYRLFIARVPEGTSVGSAAAWWRADTRVPRARCGVTCDL